MGLIDKAGVHQLAVLGLNTAFDFVDNFSVSLAMSLHTALSARAVGHAQLANTVSSR